MNFELEGRLIVKEDTVQVNDKFKKRSFVIETSETGSDGMTYTQSILMQIIQGRVNLLDSLNIGDNVKATFNIKGRPWTNKEGVVKYFNNLEAWVLEKVEGTTSASTSNNTPPPVIEEDDLPF